MIPSLDNAVFDHILSVVEAKARELRVSGVFAMAHLFTGVIMWAAVSRDCGLRIGIEDKNDANFTAIVLAKLAMVIEHQKNTGDPTTIVGEVPWMGGRLSTDGMYAYAFSGAAQEVDDLLAQVAEDEHAAL